MTFVFTLIATILFFASAAAHAGEECEVPSSLISSESDLAHAASEIKDHKRLDISVVGTGSSTLSGPNGAQFAYPARLDAALKQRLSGIEIQVVAHIQPRRTTAQMAADLKKILADDKPALVVWQAGTFDAVSGVELEEFRNSLDDGAGTIEAAAADLDLMNMQYSPRTDSILGVSAYADVMRWVAQQRSALLFDRLNIMRYWNEAGTFDLYTTTKNYDMARKVHDCIGRALASQIINAAHIVTP